MLKNKSWFLVIVSLLPVSAFADVLTCNIFGQTGSATLVFNQDPETSDSAVIMHTADRAPVGAYSSLYADNAVKHSGKQIMLRLEDRTPIDWSQSPCYVIQGGERIKLEATTGTAYEGTVEMTGSLHVDPARSTVCSIPRIARAPEKKFECKRATLTVAEE